MIGCQFHCSKRAKKDVKKSKHHLLECCNTVMKVLSNNPNYGVVIKGTTGLRKMRVKAPSLNVGKSGGYRLIYKAIMIDEVWKIALLASYFKGEVDDLPLNDYKKIEIEAANIFNEPDDFQWDSK